MTAPAFPQFDGTQICATVDPELFFPPQGTTMATGKNLCGACDFLEPCLAYALAYQVVGVWGGTSTQQRMQLRKKLGITPIPITTSTDLAADPL